MIWTTSLSRHLYLHDKQSQTAEILVSFNFSLSFCFSIASLFLWESEYLRLFLTSSRGTKCCFVFKMAYIFKNIQSHWCNMQTYKLRNKKKKHFARSFTILVVCAVFLVAKQQQKMVMIWQSFRQQTHFVNEKWTSNKCNPHTRHKKVEIHTNNGDILRRHKNLKKPHTYIREFATEIQIVTLTLANKTINWKRVRVFNFDHMCTVQKRGSYAVEKKMCEMIEIFVFYWKSRAIELVDIIELFISRWCLQYQYRQLC